jgi:hypothetical protein
MSLVITNRRFAMSDASPRHLPGGLSIAAELIALDDAITRACEEVAAAIILPTLSAEEQAEVGAENLFGEPFTRVDVVRRAVRAALDRGEIGRYGKTANFLFGI